MRGFLLAAMLLLAGCNEESGLRLGADQHGRSLPPAAGNWLVINYWAQWCGPCRREVPELNRLAVQLQGQPVLVLGVSFDQLETGPLRTAAQEMGLAYPVLQQDPAAQLGEPAARGLPLTLLVDPQGKVRARLEGEQTAAGLHSELNRLGAGLQ